jgi:hypothetical protein
MTAKDFMNINDNGRTRITQLETLKELIDNDLEKEIIVLLKNKFTTKRISQFLELNNIKLVENKKTIISIQTINNYLNKLSKDNNIEREKITTTLKNNK